MILGLRAQRLTLNILHSSCVHSSCDHFRDTGWIKGYDLYVKIQSKCSIILGHSQWRLSHQIEKGDPKTTAARCYRVSSTSIQEEYSDLHVSCGGMLKEGGVIKMPSLS